MSVKRMQGTPWHIEKITRAEGDERRHRSRCKYYDKREKFCEKRNGRCIGSAHCEEYKERQIEEEDTPQKHIKEEVEKSHKVPDLSEQIAEQVFSIGRRVVHRDRGSGVVIDLERGSDDIRVVVKFDNGTEKKYDLGTVVGSEVLKICD